MERARPTEDLWPQLPSCPSGERARERGSPASPCYARGVRLVTTLAVMSVVVWLTQSFSALTAPPTGGHAWRETDGLIVARNYCEEAAPFMQPRVSNRADSDGVTGLEFPVLNWISGGVGCRTGDYATPWRVLSLLFTLSGAAAVFFFARRRWGQPTAAWCLLVFATSPLVPYFGRSTQPDAVAMGLAGLALLIPSSPSGERRSVAAVLAPLLISLAALIKLPAIVYLLPVFVLGWSAARSRALLLLTTALSLLPPFLWYRYARALELTNGLTNFGVTRSPSQLLGEWLMPEFWRLDFTQHPLDVWVFPLVTVVVLLVALVRVRARQFSRLLVLLGATVLAYLFLCGYSGAHHDYYGLILVPLFALGGGRALAVAVEWLGNRRGKLVPAAVVTFALAAMGYQVFRGWHWWPRHQAEWAAFQSFSEKTLGPPGPNRVMVFSGGSPQLFWFSHQHGGFGLLHEPAVPAGRYGLVDRLRLKSDAARIEATLKTAGCQPLFENEVVFACGMGPPGFEPGTKRL